MLASITPLGERGRQATWTLTVGAFLTGATVAGAAAGALAGAAGSLVLGSVGERARLTAMAVVLVAAIVLDSLPGGVPGPARQVNERWLDEFRSWVYGLGFGAQLGLAVTTVVSSAATYVALIAALLTGEPARGALVLGCFGAIRGLTPMTAAWVRRPDQLIALHARLDRWRGPMSRLGRALLAALLGLASVGALS